MKTEDKKQLATDLGKTLSVTEEPQPEAIHYPFGHLSDDAQRFAITKSLFESLNVRLNAIGLNISRARLGGDGSRTPQECYEALVREQLIPARKVEASKSTGDVPSWLEGNLC